MPTENPGQNVIISNRKARHDYLILDTLETGIALKGTEVKSLRQGNANLQDSYAMLRRGELWLIGMHISPFDKGNINNHDPIRDRKLLVHKRELLKLKSRTEEKGLTLVPLTVYFTKNIVKVELAVAKGKKLYDKREAIAKRDVERQLRRDYAR